jgi:two-component system cell cycle sensor histidine kinase/response regulator CckA
LAAELLLPASQLSRATRRATIELPLRGDETILLVDDEEALVRISQRMLQRLGYTVVPMSCPLEADAYLQKNPKSIDLLLTDLMMPRLSGVDLAERAAVHVPGLPILLTTGRTDSQLDAEGEPSAFYAVITKPYARLDLASAVRKALDASARGGRRLHGPPLPSAVSTKSGAP